MVAELRPDGPSRERVVALAATLRRLGADMEETALVLQRFPTRRRWVTHGLELQGAAAMVRDWAVGLEREDAP
ncbi:MAG: hypothetical protein EOM92_12495 [Gammaproteobacteria bacterium]|jgi:hypothetical protein|nr:hypothetical protein [Gammaproteobacteria bacterium]